MRWIVPPYPALCLAGDIDVGGDKPRPYGTIPKTGTCNPNQKGVTSMSSNYPSRRRLRLKNFDYSKPFVYFVTICEKSETPAFLDDRLNRQLIECLLEKAHKFGMRIYSYCLMPDHFHCLVQPIAGQSVSDFIGEFKGKSVKIFRDAGRQLKWQRSFYDHIVRQEEDLRELAEYILNNPVRRGMVTDYRHYEYSGPSQYDGRG